MPKITKILCPVDFSEGSDRALDYAVSLAKQLGADVWMTHVYELPLYSVPSGVAYAAGQPGELFDFVRGVKERIQTKLDELKAKFQSAGPALHTRLVEGAPAGSIVDLADEMSADLIVLGTHGRTGLPHLLMGSVAERVARTSRCPVLVVPIAR